MEPETIPTSLTGGVPPGAAPTIENTIPGKVQIALEFIRDTNTLPGTKKDVCKARTAALAVLEVYFGE